MFTPLAGKRLRFTPLALTTVLLSAGLLSMSVTGTLSGFTAAITNSLNTAGTGSLTMQETGPGTSVCNSTDGGSVATNTATCSTINKFGGSVSMVPNVPVATSVTIANTGSVKASTFTLTPGTTCTQTGSVSGSANDLCAKMHLTITQNGTQFFTGTLASFAVSPATPIALTSVASHASSTFVFTVTLDGSADNTYQGLQAAMPMTWTFTS